MTDLLVATAAGGILTAAVFMTPIWLIYKQRSLGAAATISLIAAVLHRHHWAIYDFSNIGLVADLLVLAISLPIAMWIFLRLRPNNSFKPSPLRGLGRDRPASGGPA